MYMLAIYDHQPVGTPALVVLSLLPIPCPLPSLFPNNCCRSKFDDINI